MVRSSLFVVRIVTRFGAIVKSKMAKHIVLVLLLELFASVLLLVKNRMLFVKVNILFTYHIFRLKAY
jgi:hypothetical protein